MTKILALRVFTLIWFHILALFCAGFSYGAEVKLVHVVVALADNVYQGIVPIPEKLGDGDEPLGNLYWGAAYGMKTFFSKKADGWQRVKCYQPKSRVILERCLFTTKKSPEMMLVADAYRGREIAKTMQDFMDSAAGRLGLKEAWSTNKDAAKSEEVRYADLAIYVGHNGLMDAPLQWVTDTFPKREKSGKQAVVLACKSEQYFSRYLVQSGAQPLVMTYDFMAPEAYVVHAIVEGARLNEDVKLLRVRAAKAYAQYQKISERSARRVFGAPNMK